MCKKMKFAPTQMKYAKPRIRPGESDVQTFPGFWDRNGLPNVHRPDIGIGKIKKGGEPVELWTFPF